MKPERWDKIQELFEAAIDLQVSEQKAYLEAQCGDDTALLAEVWSLVEADRREHGLLDGSAADIFSPDLDQSLEGRTVGPYRLQKRIASGGMGAVFLAVRDDGQFIQKVALKLIKRGMDSEEILRRFQAERQILARLQHPNIARLLDGGLTDDGLPYFSMEYVDGLPIDDYCNTHRLTVPQRLKLFEEVCTVVEYAQQNLIVHRDLKPSNIMVTAGGTVKLLDFGIAKVLDDDPESPELSNMTRTGMRVMTPGYAAPEQIRTAPITTATDVYALGVVLYELLCGRRPYKSDLRSPQELEEAVCVQNPERPGKALTAEDDPEAEAVARDRGVPLAKLQKQLSGDLDNICLMALRKEPERRYRSAGQLRDDIRRHLAGMPVSARPDTFGYRSGKFVRRHMASVVSLIVVLIMIGVLVAYYTSKLTDERDRARMEAAKTAEVSEFLFSLFEVADPWESRGEDITARELLERGADRIQTELSGEPEIQANMMNVIGEVYRNLGMYEESQPLFEAALRIRGELFGRESEEYASSLRGLSFLVYELNKWHEAETLAAEVLALDRKLLDPEDPQIAQDLNDLASTYRHLERFAEAETLYTEALRIRRKVLGPDHPDVAHTMNHLARLLYNRGMYAESEPMFREALAMRMKHLGNDNPEIAASANSLAGALFALGDYDGAGEYSRMALTIMEKVYGQEHNYVAGIQGVLATIRDKQGRYDEADSLAQLSLHIARATLPAGHVRLSSPLIVNGVILTERGRAEEAIPLLKEALRLREANLPESHLQVLLAKSALGYALSRAGRYDAAESLLREGFEGVSAVRPDTDYLVIRARKRVEELYTLWGKPDLAADYR